MARRFNSFVAAPPIAPYAGPVSQTVAVQQTPAVRHIDTGSQVRWYINGNQTVTGIQPITVTYNTTTMVNNNYVVSVNNNPYYATTGTVTFLTDTVTWSRWNQQYTVSTNTYATNGMIWANWTGNVPVYNAVDMHREVTRRGLTYARPVETPEEREARRQAEALALFQRVEAERIATQSAAERALGTLLGLLTAEQRDEYARHGYFHVVGSEGRLYRILKGSSGNIRRVISKDDPGKGEAAFCVHSVSRVDHTMEEHGLVPGHLPHEDHMIQQMLHLMIDEREILAKANIHWGTREPTDAEIERFFAAQEASERENALMGTLAPL